MEKFSFKFFNESECKPPRPAALNDEAAQSVSVTNAG
jgi:hypothetical protein